MLAALRRMSMVVEKLEAQVVAQAQRHAAELGVCEIEAAHLRREISDLKRDRDALESKRAKLAARLDKALTEIDDILEGSANAVAASEAKPMEDAHG